MWSLWRPERNPLSTCMYLLIMRTRTLCLYCLPMRAALATVELPSDRALCWPSCLPSSTMALDFIDLVSLRGAVVFSKMRPLCIISGIRAPSSSREPRLDGTIDSTLRKRVEAIAGSWRTSSREVWIEAEKLFISSSDWLLPGTSSSNTLSSDSLPSGISRAFSDWRLYRAKSENIAPTIDVLR